MILIEWYFRCQCGAMFFSHDEFDTCPDCGAELESLDYRIVEP